MKTSFETESVLTFSAMSVAAFGVTLLWAVLLAWPFQLLWNWLVPAIFGLGRITFLQALGLKLLLSLVFGKVSFNENR